MPSFPSLDQLRSDKYECYLQWLVQRPQLNPSPLDFRYTVMYLTLHSACMAENSNE